MESYKELLVWQRSIELVSEIYRITDSFPKSEQFGLISQMRRAAVSIPSNIAEGYARKHRAEYIHFCRVAFGSGAELETQLIVAKNLSFLLNKDAQKVEQLLSDTMRMLNKLLASLVAKP